MIYFDGKSLGDFQCHVDELTSLVRPEWDTEDVDVPGRNGTLTFSNGRFRNVTETYDCMIAKNFNANYAALMAYLSKDPDYHRLYADAEKDTFRVAKFKDMSEPHVEAWFQRATFTLRFDCKPQRFLRSGDISITVKSGDTLRNGYLYDSQPLIRVYGYGTLYIGHYSVVIADYGQKYIDLDCETMDAYNGTLNLNEYVTTSTDTFPVLVPGDNGIKTEGNITGVEITPRWWTI